MRPATRHLPLLSRRTTIPRLPPSTAEQSATELTRLVHERARLLRELVMLRHKAQAAETQLQQIEARLDAVGERLIQALGPATRAAQAGQGQR